ncbi:MAG: Gfo/Idh/MocA family oxidoreductase [Chloroflexi bacterium]|nr:Gfo/Idh/MocA family oxidoreductase [Chloroflexota bacterium]
MSGLISDSAPIRWGIIGCGDVTEVKSGPALQKAQGSSLVAVMRRNGALAQDYARRHNVAKWYDSAQALIDDPDVNAIYIATPPSSHRQYALMAAAAGKPAYVEKPMALNHRECQDMIEACEQAGVPLFVAYYRRALPRFLKIKALVENGAIGRVRFVNITLHQPILPHVSEDETPPWRVLPEIAGGGLFVDLASHQLDLLDFLFGPITEVCGFAANQAGRYPAEDIVTGTFRFESGVQGAGVWCFSAYDDMDRTEIVGDKGRIVYETFGESPIIVSAPEGVNKLTIANPRHIQQPLIQQVVDALLGRGTCISTGVSAARTTWVMDHMLRDYYGANHAA